jgi:carbohydrate kinase (thermoresistant glucokinase family)
MGIVIMGVSGSGKSTVGWALSKRLGWSYFDGDDYHSDENIGKMARGTTLTDVDRDPWLEKLSELISENVNAGRSVIASCSALKQVYRDRLRQAAENILIVFLKGDPERIMRRMKERNDHFMKTEMLVGQLATLEEPVDAFTVNIDKEVELIADDVFREIQR